MSRIIKNSWFIWKYVTNLKKLGEQNISQEFRLRNLDETRNEILENVKQYEFMRRKHRKVWKTLILLKTLLF